MSHPEPLWSFSSEVCSERQKKLHAWTSFDQIIVRLSTCAVAQLYWEPASAPHLKGCHRASFELQLDPDLYDGFFNAPVGYRGQFARSEATGESANRTLIDTLLPRLMASSNHEAMLVGRVKASLLGEQAKVWIVESEVDEELGAPRPSIVYPPWDFNAPDSQGLRAPRGTRIEVKGAWLAADGSEVVNQIKRRRSNFIYLTGDSK